MTRSSLESPCLCLYFCKAVYKKACSGEDTGYRKEHDHRQPGSAGRPGGAMETKNGVMAVLADGAGKEFGGRIASRIAVDTCMDIFGDFNAFHNPQYYFRKAFHSANLEILKALGDENRGSASVGCVFVASGYVETIVGLQWRELMKL